MLKHAVEMHWAALSAMGSPSPSLLSIAIIRGGCRSLARGTRVNGGYKGLLVWFPLEVSLLQEFSRCQFPSDVSRPKGRVHHLGGFVDTGVVTASAGRHS